ncbi:uncharacterized protein LOC34619708 [Cyclospora cayetanensis]|uniref:Uncharacterized protein n=2 Tax=Cyclospora cayetanensis TaxID=88456 RepID=A0A1D3D7P4_9EIME|nr:uncharacterized protein LOC34619708 [Cyclospora cayetanensis]OEH79473.1 hypothetical protein cyc_02941 [Cyclospora cayetanensis]
MEQSAYPSPYPAYTETYLTPDGYNHGGNMNNGLQMNAMAYYAGGPDPSLSCAPSVGSMIRQGNEVEVHRFDPTPVYNYQPSCAPPLYQPAPATYGSMYTDPSMQTFSQAFEGNFPFYDTLANSGMPQGYHIAMQGFPEAVEARKAIKKQISTPAEMIQKAEQKKPQQRRRPIACC